MIEPAKARFDLQRNVLNYCRHIAGSAEITAVSLVDTGSIGKPTAMAPVEAVLVIRGFPPLAYGATNLMRDTASKKEASPVLDGYVEALKQLEKEKRIVFDDDYIMISKKFITETKKPKVRLTAISKNTPRTLFTSVFEVFPQLLNFLSQNTEALLKLQKFQWKKGVDEARRFVDPQEYIFVPTAKGFVSLGDKSDVEGFARKMLLSGEEGTIELEPIGGVLNDVYLIKVNSKDG